MNKIKYIALLVLTTVMFTSCDSFLDDELRDYQEFVGESYGILPTFTAGNNSVYNLLDPSNSIVDFTIEATVSGGAVATSGEIHAAINNGAFTKVSDISSFPFNVNISLAEVVNGLGTTTANLTGGDIVHFKTFFTDASGATTTAGRIFSAAIVCPPVAGTYTINMQDSFGDGWQGGGVNAILDGVTTFITLVGATTEGTATFVVPEGSTALVWAYVNDDWNEEVSFQIIDPNGVTINSSANPTAGVLTVPSTCP